MKKKQLVGVLSALIILSLVLALVQNIFNANKDLSIEAQPQGPRVLAQKPIEGQRLTLQPEIEITFDRAMEQGKTTSAFAFVQGTDPVPGEITWSDARTLVFTPDKPLDPSTEYSAVIDQTAAGIDGLALEESIELEFTTVDSLAVTQVFPAVNTHEVELNSSVTVIFNHPIVPLRIKEEQKDLPQPLVFTPDITGTGEWVNSSVYVFQPDEGLLSGNRYQVRVDPALRDTNGLPLDETFSWEFHTRQPYISSYYLKNGEFNPGTEVSDVPLDQVFVIEFGQPMNRETVEPSISIIDRETRTSVPVKFEWNEELTAITIVPTQNFKLSGFYDLLLAADVLAADGGMLREGLDLKFATVPHPFIKNILPGPDAKLVPFQSYIQIEFASIMDIDTLKTRVQVTPEIKDSYMYFDRYSRSLYIYGLEPSTDYILRILPGMADVYGNTIKDGTSLQFTNGALAPYARLGLPWSPLVYRADGSQDLYFQHLNLAGGRISVFPITVEEFHRLADSNSGEFHPLQEPVREWQIEQGAKNTLIYEHFQLDEDQEPLTTGYYYVGVSASNLDYTSNFYQGNVFMVATDNLTFKATDTEGLAWVTDLESGRPRSGVNVTFYNPDFYKVGSATTDQDGVARVDKLQNAQYAVVDDGRDLAFTDLYWGSGVSPYDMGIYESYYSSSESLFGYLYTDRPVYRPDQDVYFKGILRENDDLHYSLANHKRIYVVVEQWGEQIFADYVNVNDEGSFSALVHLGSEISLGSYTISASSSPASDIFASVNFNVAEYRKPEFEVNVTPSQQNALPGDTVEYAVDGTYYSGGTVGGSEVGWFIQARDYYFTPAALYNSYGFIDWDRDERFPPSNGNYSETIKEGEGSADENGHLDVSQVLDFGNDKRSREIQFLANVTDVAGNTVSGGTSIIMHESQYYAGIKSESYVAQAGEAADFGLVVLDWDSNPIAGQAVTVRFVQRQWMSVQKQDEQGQLSWETSVKEIPVTTVNAVTGEDGTTIASFVPPNGGTYKAIVTVRDPKGNIHQASAYVWVTGEDYIPWRRTNDSSFDLIADKDLYSAGDTADILIAQPFEGKVYALVTYERGHIYKEEVIELEGSSTIYKLPITDELAPIAYVTVTVIAGTENGGGRPDYKIGITKINIDTTEKMLEVNVTADRDSAGPGDQVTYTIETMDSSGDPVAADVSLAVVDKAALALAPSNSPPLLSSFYPQKGLGVMTALGLISSADEYNENYEASIPDGSKMGGGGGGEPGIITVREDFKDTAAFEAYVSTDENGQGQVTVKLPENLTTWHADVRAITADGRVGEATSELVSTRPLFIQLQTPRFFVVGDQAQIGAIIHNNTDETLNVNATLGAEGVQIESDLGHALVLEGRQQAYVTWNVTVDADAERVDLTATVMNDKYSDASKPPLGTLSDHGIPVLNFAVNETVGTSGMLTSSNSATELIQLPETLEFSNAYLNIEMAPTLAASMQSGLTYLEDFEYLCMEQTISRFLPNVVTSRALSLAGMEDANLSLDLDQNVSMALQRIYARQNADGGWNWWDGEKSDPQTSAYVVYGLIEARESGYEISDDVYEKGVNYIKYNLPVVRRNDASWVFNRRSFMMYVLARAGELNNTQANLTFDYRESLDLYGTAYLAQALHLMDPKDRRVDTLMSDLQSAAILSASGAHWEEITRDYWNWNTDMRTTAIVLNAFTQINPKSPLTANAVRWLMAHRQSGHWRSTQETAWSLIALTNWMVASKEYDTDYKFAIGLNNELLEQGEVNEENLMEKVDLQIDLADLIREQANSLVFSRGRGDGNLYYSAYLTAELPVEKIEPLDQGVTLSREYFALDDLKNPITSIAHGELVRVRLTVVIPASVHYVVINDPLPAGLEALDASLATDAAVPESYTALDYDERGWGWWYFSHVELRDEKVVLSSDYLLAGTYVYTYLARASTSGTFKVIPPTASEFYFPDVGGRGAGSLFVVEE